jgi:hypothetical protein
MNADANLAKAVFLEAVEKHDPEHWPPPVLDKPGR